VVTVPVVRADQNMCQGYANCVLQADDVFDVDDDGTVVLLRTTIPEDDRTRVTHAALSCPVGALSVEDA
jgi:ferredoxin